MTYKVGLLELPRKDDPEFSDYEEAEGKAIELSKNNEGTGIAIRMGRWDVFAIVFDEEVFKK